MIGRLSPRGLVRHFSSSSIESSLVKPSIPDSLEGLPIVGVHRRPLFPGFYKTLPIKDLEQAEFLEERFKLGKTFIGTFMFRSPSNELAERSSIFEVGTLSQVINLIPMTNLGGTTAILYPHKRVALRDFSLIGNGGALGRVEVLKDEQYDKRVPLITALCQEIFSVLADIAKINPFFREHISHHNVSSSFLEDSSKLADFVAVLCSGESHELQEILESLDVEQKLRKALVILKKEQITSELQNAISKDVEQKLSQKQREYFLHEQLRTIKKELGLESDVREKLASSFVERLSALNPPESIRHAFDEELRRFSSLDPGSSEYVVSRNYLEWICSIPWGVFTTDSFDISNAEEILNLDHYGLNDVKTRILEFIAIGGMKRSVEGKVLCLVGPPGVGKTSIAGSIARCLSRHYYRFSVGGLSDVAEIKGHRRTYIGSLPGKIIQSLKITRSMNPVIVVDEIDKMSRGHQGDPASALLEVFDPQQNSSFHDYYLDLPTDLSKVLFICTANSLDTIPQPLLDRMEIFELSGYLQDEKREIAKRHLIPQIVKQCGTEGLGLTLDDKAIDFLISAYNRESGVRGLQKSLEKIHRKSALEYVRTSQTQAKVDTEQIKRLMGPPLFEDKVAKEPFLPVGVSRGLAWTPMGGSAIYVESALLKTSSPSLTITGQLGKVMEESVRIAISYVRGILPSAKKLSSGSIHLHVPEGSTPKDGPSAGITIASSVLSLLSGEKLPSNIGMTGELTLTGKVLRVGGLREKIIAARRSGLKRVILPAENSQEFENLEDHVKSGIEVVYASDFSKVIEACFPALAK